MELLGMIAVGLLVAAVAFGAALMLGKQVGEQDIKPSTGRPYWEHEK